METIANRGGYYLAWAYAMQDAAAYRRAGNLRKAAFWQNEAATLRRIITR